MKDNVGWVNEKKKDLVKIEIIEKKEIKKILIGKNGVGKEKKRERMVVKVLNS